MTRSNSVHRASFRRIFHRLLAASDREQPRPSVPRRGILSRESGFTMIELVLVLALIGILSLIGFPALLNMLKRAKHEGVAREGAALMRAARLEAIKTSTEVYVQADFAGDRIVTFKEDDGTAGLSAGDEEIDEVILPPQIFFSGPANGIEGADAVVGFDGNDYVTFGFRGDANALGAIRIGDQAGLNFLELNVEPPATGRVEIRKWDGSAWKGQGEDDVSWEWN